MLQPISLAYHSKSLSLSQCVCVAMTHVFAIFERRIKLTVSQTTSPDFHYLMRLAHSPFAARYVVFVTHPKAKTKSSSSGCLPQTVKNHKMYFLRTSVLSRCCTRRVVVQTNDISHEESNQGVEGLTGVVVNYTQYGRLWWVDGCLILERVESLYVGVQKRIFEFAEDIC